MQVFIGYDPRQPVAAQVLAHSIWAHASKPVSITRLELHQLPITRTGLTEFTYSRFLCPWLCDYTGQSLYLDADMLCLTDIYELAALALDEMTPVCVVKNPIRFEWPSLMVFDNASCRKLAPSYVQHGNPFSFEWASEVGALPAEWNHLVGYDALNAHAKVVHFTQGIPIWEETRGCEFSTEWQISRNAMNHTVSFQELMGPSVHIPYMKERVCPS